MYRQTEIVWPNKLADSSSSVLKISLTITGTYRRRIILTKLE